MRTTVGSRRPASGYQGAFLSCGTAAPCLLSQGQPGVVVLLRARGAGPSRGGGATCGHLEVGRDEPRVRAPPEGSTGKVPSRRPWAGTRSGTEVLPQLGSSPASTSLPPPHFLASHRPEGRPRAGGWASGAVGGRTGRNGCCRELRPEAAFGLRHHSSTTPGKISRKGSRSGCVPWK